MRQTTLTPKVKRPKSEEIDADLAMHLQKAEEHLIAAVELFSQHRKPQRRVGYKEKLTRLQEGVTALYAEELILKRGQMNPKGKIRS